MTGFGKAETRARNKKVTVELRSVNCKQADINVRTCTELRYLEMSIRKLITQELQRGKVDAYVNLEEVTEEPTVTFNSQLAKQYWEQLQTFGQESGIPLPPDPMRTILTMPGVVVHEAVDDPETEAKMEQLVLETTQNACQALNEFRKQEGEALAEGFVKNITTIQDLLTQVEPFEGERVTEIRERLEEGLRKYVNTEYDRSRLEQEMIYYIEKLDVNEEKNRLQNHLNYFLETLSADSVGQGRKLGFIAQEIGREINTLGSKSNHATIQKIVVRMKDELEQIKEQVLNVL